MLINEPVFTKGTLRKLLANNELGGYDPVKEAFKVYDPNGFAAPYAPPIAPPGVGDDATSTCAIIQSRPPCTDTGTGFVDPETLRGIFSNLGYGEITDEDLKVLVNTADADGDGALRSAPPPALRSRDLALASLLRQNLA